MRLITRAARPTTIFDSTVGFSGFFQLSSVVRFRQHTVARAAQLLDGGRLLSLLGAKLEVGLQGLLISLLDAR